MGFRRVGGSGKVRKCLPGAVALLLLLSEGSQWCWLSLKVVRELWLWWLALLQLQPAPALPDVLFDPPPPPDLVIDEPVMDEAVPSPPLPPVVE